jgi:hypothetical protein
MDFDSYCEWAAFLARKYGIPQPTEESADDGDDTDHVTH